jgi:hypothetical protein
LDSSPTVPIVAGLGAAAVVISGGCVMTPICGGRDRWSPARTNNASVASRIAHGHAWDKHWEDFVGLGITNQDEFAEHIQDAMDNPSQKPLARDRTAYLDDKIETVVIHDPHNRDAGTAFRPRNARRYFRGLR